MWLVRIALSRPYTFVVLTLMLLMMGVLAILRTPTDIFPSINIPVISVIWTYNGLSPDDMANRITTVFERAVTTTVNDIEHIESESLIGVSVTKLFFQSGVSIAMALSEVTAISQTLLKRLPPGATPPLILNYNASTVPVMQLLLSSELLPEQEINDIGNNYIRTELATVQGAALPSPYGGKVRQIMVDLNIPLMQTYGMSAQTISTAINEQTLMLPSGTQKIGPYEYLVTLNNSPLTVDELNDLPVTYANNRVLYVRDVAHVRDGFAPQTNIVRVNGERAVMMSIQKTGNASTLDIIRRVKTLLVTLKDNLPESLHLFISSDQSIFVMAAIKGVVVEAITAAILTGLMIFLFLGSLRSTFIITLSIPLSILASICLMSMLGETINIMTLGGLALAVGILVDDATVAIENINWNLEQGKPVQQAILDGAMQISIPALVSTLCICIVFVPMFFLGGVAKYLFVPMAEAVVFAMLASYLLSRTLVPTMALYLLRPQKTPVTPTFVNRLHQGFEHHFEAFRQRYRLALIWVLHHTRLFMIAFMTFVVLSLLCLWPWLGSNFFPMVDAGEMKLHIRAPTGTRVEETARLVSQIDDMIREVIPSTELDSIVDNIGLPVSGINLSYSNSATVGSEDADVMISLKKGHRPSTDYMRMLRFRLEHFFPGVSIAFLPADIVNQILNFGLPSPINIQLSGPKLIDNQHYANSLLKRLKHIPGIVDARIRQAYNYPELKVQVDRTLAITLGLTQRDVANNVLIPLSGSFQTAPNFWIDPKNGTSYPIFTQLPDYAADSLQVLRNIPITNVRNSSRPQILGALADITPAWASAVVSHYNVQPVIDIFAAVQDRDLGSVAKDINALILDTKNDLPKGSHLAVHGQMETQHQAFTSLYFGLIFSIVLIYLLIVINLQSWLDPFIIITALPAALAGITWILFITHTTLSVPALTGAIMCMGVATANSILVINFARSLIQNGHDPFTAALEAGVARLRPVLMTALAMILGMLPMALGFSEGGEQNAPLGRTVMGGLLFATVATLFFVPALFSMIHSRHQGDQDE
jgi:multidrug efflux pump subunit AcrB